jgi:hypothetical protein
VGDGRGGPRREISASSRAKGRRRSAGHARPKAHRGINRNTLVNTAKPPGYGSRRPCLVTPERCGCDDRIGGIVSSSRRRMRGPTRLAPTAASPASTATAAPPASTTGSPSAPAATCASAPTTAPGRLYGTLERCVVLMVEDVEGRQVDVGNLFLTEEEFVMRRGILRRYIHS